MGNNISEAEAELMQIIWESKDDKGNYLPISTNEIADKVKDKWSVSAVSTFLVRMEKKGFIKSDKRGRCNVFTAVVKESDYKAEESRRFIDRLYNGSVRGLLASLCDNRATQEELEEIEKLLQEAKEKSR